MIVLNILAIYTLSFVIRNLPGPFNSFGIIRNWFMRLPFFIGIFFYQLLECPWCIGFHCGYFIYLLTSFNHIQLNFFLLWGLAGSAIVAIIDQALERLSK